MGIRFGTSSSTTVQGQERGREGCREGGKGTVRMYVECTQNWSTTMYMKKTEAVEDVKKEKR
jgi:hypothetical protein